MTEPLIIDGWVCRLVRGQRSAQNYALEMGAWLLPDGRMKTEGAETDGGPVTVTVPPAVLAWLIRPLLYDAWFNGCRKGYHGANAVDDNPHKDP